MGHVVAVIPARGGSKGVPKKNVRPLAGRPLIAYTIDVAKQCPKLARVIVSTDDAQIAQIAKQEGAEVVMRPAELAADDAPTEAALLHVLTMLQAEGYEVDVVVTLEPTSPLRTAALIERCLDTLQRTDADSVMTVVETRECLGTLEASGRFAYLRPGQPRRRQDRQPLYKESGAVYATKTGVLQAQRLICGGRLYGVVITAEEGTDINTPADFAIAEALMNGRRSAG